MYQLIEGTQSCGASLEMVKYLGLGVSHEPWLNDRDTHRPPEVG